MGREGERGPQISSSSGSLKGLMEVLEEVILLTLCCVIFKVEGMEGHLISLNSPICA